MSRHSGFVWHRRADLIWVLRSVFSQSALRYILGVWLRLHRKLPRSTMVRRNESMQGRDPAGELVILDCDSGEDNVVTQSTVYEQTRKTLNEILDAGDARTIVFVVGDSGLDLGRALAVRQRQRVVLDSELPPFSVSLGLLVALITVFWLVFEQIFDDGVVSLLASAVAVLLPAIAMKGLEEKIVEAQARSRDILELEAFSVLRHRFMALKADMTAALESVDLETRGMIDERRHALDDDLLLLKRNTLSPDLEERIRELQKQLKKLA